MAAKKEKVSEAVAEEVKEVQTPTLAAADINLMVQIIDAGCKKGIFVGNDLSLVGNLHDKLKGIVDALSVPAPAGEAPAEPAEADAKAE